MKANVLKILLLLTLTASAFSQVATKVRSVISLPATCSPGDGVQSADEIILVSGGNSTLEVCSSANTWTPVLPGSGNGGTFVTGGTLSGGTGATLCNDGNNNATDQNCPSTGSGPTVHGSNPTINTLNVQNGATVDSLNITSQLTISSPYIWAISGPGNQDWVGVITLSGGSGSYTFVGTYGAQPVCFVWDSTNPSSTPAASFTLSSGQWTMNLSGGNGSDSVNYFCPAALPAPLVPTTTYAAETGNNTPACSAVGVPSYCTMAEPNLQSEYGYAQTQTLAPLPGFVSTEPMSDYLYPGATTAVVAAMQPWFGMSNCWSLPYSGSANHPCVGYNQNTASVVAAEDSFLASRGFTILSPDWYGNSSSQSFINTTVQKEAADLAGRCSTTTCPLYLSIMIDKGLITSGMSNASACPTGSTDETSCIITVLEAAYKYIDQNWGQQIYYWKDPTSGLPLTFTFLAESSWSGTNWSGTGGVWPTLKSWMTSNLSSQYAIVKEYGNFTESSIDGAYGWPQPPSPSSSNQYCWYSSTCGSDYFNALYTNGQANPSKITVGLMFAGYDGSNNNYNNNLIARQCGQVLYNTGQRIWHSGGSGYTYYSSSKQLPYVIVYNMNDYGEGGQFEDGISNCYTITASISTNTLSWTLNKTDSTYANAETIHHLKIWYENPSDPQSNLYLAQNNIPASTSSVSLSSIIPSGTWNIYVEVVGYPLMTNHMSNSVSYTH